MSSVPQPDTEPATPDAPDPDRTPEISIVIPAWGTHATYVPAAVASLLEQEGPSIEIVVVDNASDVPIPPLPDAARVVRTRERLRVGGARNAGLDEARAPSVMFWDADDVMLPGALARMAGVLREDPGVVAVTMDSVRWTPETGPGERWPWPRGIMYRLARRRPAFAAIATVYNAFTTTGPALMRTAEVRDAGGFASEIAFFEDWALATSLTVRGRVVMLREIARLYRVHDESLTLGHLGHPDEAVWLRGLRDRMRHDPRRPRWLKAGLPFIWVHHRRRVRRSRRADAGVGFYEAALDGLAAPDASEDR